MLRTTERDLEKGSVYANLANHGSPIWGMSAYTHGKFVKPTMVNTMLKLGSWLLVLLLFLGVSLKPSFGQPSFDCSKARLPDEKAICDDSILSAADQLIAHAYKRFQGDFQEKKRVARSYLSDRNSCRTDRACIASIQNAMLSTYAGYDYREYQQPWVASGLTPTLRTAT
jgi:hypothetical protein